MSLISSPHFLRRVLRADAIVSPGSGALQLLFTAWLADLTGLGQALLLEVGILYLVYGVFVAWLATRAEPPRALVWLLVLGNAGWAVACLALLALGVYATTTLDTAYVVLQAVAVALLSDLQFLGVRRAPAKFA